ncbi:MAG: hypothetical protein HC889_16095 [Synechococcaceae cyanobacterium SM1_2_3]|nr:hypothetical protein [Synechococcaceae cyanobacterium SM1_2_3]
MAIDANVSDLFFNLDHDDCKLHGSKGEFIGWNAHALYDQATWFCDTLGRLGVKVDPGELIQDFHGRV